MGEDTKQSARRKTFRIRTCHYGGEGGSLKKCFLHHYAHAPLLISDSRLTTSCQSFSPLLSTKSTGSPGSKMTLLPSLRNMVICTETTIVSDT